MIEIERLTNKRLARLEKLKILVIEKYKRIYELEGIEENYINQFLDEIKEGILK